MLLLQLVRLQAAGHSTRDSHKVVVEEEGEVLDVDLVHPFHKGKPSLRRNQLHNRRAGVVIIDRLLNNNRYRRQSRLEPLTANHK